MAPSKRKSNIKKQHSLLQFIKYGKKNQLNFLLYGLIVYDETNPEIRKMLNDNDFWSGLSKASGDRLAVFAIRDKRTNLSINNNISKDNQDHSEQIMYDISELKDSDYKKSYSMLISELLGYELKIQHPFVILFQIIEHKAHGFQIIKIPSPKSDIYGSFKELFNAINLVLQDITQENFKNKIEIMTLVKNEIRNRKFKQNFIKAVKPIAEFISIISAFL
jgi:hypothetical protein